MTHKKILLSTTLIASMLLCGAVSCKNPTPEMGPVNFQVPSEGFDTTKDITIKFYTTMGQELQNVFMKLWPMPTTTFEPLKHEAESASLDDEDYEFTGKKLQAYMLHGVRYTVNTWKEMLIQVCGHILMEKRSTLEWLCANETHGFSHTSESWRKELAPNMYVWTDNSTYTKINILRGMLNECNIPLSELVFEFRTDVVEGDED